jgi:hypothetical protein
MTRTRLVAQRAHLIEFTIRAFADETAVALEKRQFVGEHRAEQGGAKARSGKCFQMALRSRRQAHPSRSSTSIEIAPLFFRRRWNQTLPKIAPRSRGPPRSKRDDATGRAACREAMLQRIVAGPSHKRRPFIDEPKGDGIEPCVDRLPDRSSGDINRSARSRAPPLGYGAVRWHSAAMPLRFRRTACFTSSRLARVAGSMKSVEAAAFALRCTERRTLGDLRLFHIGDGGGWRPPAPHAKRCRNRPASKRRNSGRCGLPPSRCRRAPPAAAPPRGRATSKHRAEFLDRGIVLSGDDQLARIDAPGYRREAVTLRWFPTGGKCRSKCRSRRAPTAPVLHRHANAGNAPSGSWRRTARAVFLPSACRA